MRTGLAQASNVYPRRIDATAESGTWMHRHHLAPMAIVALLLLVAAACSSGQNSSSSTVAPPDAAETEAETDDGQTTSGSGTDDRDVDTGEADTGDAAGLPSVETVSFPSGDLRLEGNLHLPATQGPHPAVVLVHGSGPINRQSVLTGQLALQFGFGIPVFDELARPLAHAGWVVLAYDKRSCGTFNGCGENAYPLPDDSLTTDTFAGDAQAAVSYLRSRSEVDPDRVTVAGHSQGSTFVPRLLRDDPQLQAGIMLAAPFDSVDQVLADQAAFVAKLVGPDAASEPSVVAAAEVATQVAALRADPSATAPVAGASAAFWRTWMDAGDETPGLLAEVTQPVLLLFGGNDWNVPVDQAAQWREATQGLDHVQLAAVECITHALNCLTESEPTKITAADIGRAVDPTVPASMTEFLAEV